jgi:hypothetical protein
LERAFERVLGRECLGESRVGRAGRESGEIMGRESRESGEIMERDQGVKFE